LSDLTAVSLFAGVGGFDLAFKRAGVKVTAAVEIDKKCREVLAQHFPETKLFDDVKEVTGEQLRATGFVPERGIIAGGFPCQDLSIAGLRKGLDGSRSGLFHEIIRLADELKPQFLILENVAGLLSSQRGKDMGIVITALVERGYGVCWRVLDSQNFGVAQRRRRVFIVASLGDHRRPAEILFERESGFWNLETSRKKRQTTSSAIEGSVGVNSFQKSKRAQTVDDDESWVESGIVPTLNVFDSGDSRTTTVVTQEPTLLRMRGGKDGGGKGALVSENKSLTIATGNDQTLFLFEGNRVGDPRVHENVSPSVIARWGTGGNNVPMISEPIVRRLTPRECERLQGFPDDWTIGQADSTRYKMMGNAVTVPVVEWIVDRMVKLVVE
jgi:DNA (cytosine-5)-methyltransferase 1